MNTMTDTSKCPPFCGCVRARADLRGADLTGAGPVSGGWAQACDGKSVARDDDHAEWAVVSLGQAMVWTTPEAVERVLYAGARIRAWRKSLPVQYERVDDDLTEIPTDRLLWHALRHVGRAEFWTPKEALVASEELRVAEALLRTWWKRRSYDRDLTGADPDGGVGAHKVAHEDQP